MAALQLMLVCGTLLIALGLVPFLYFVAHWYLMQSSPLEAWDSPPRSLIRRLSARGERRKPLSSVEERNADSTGQQPDSKPIRSQLGEEVVGGIRYQQPDNLPKPCEGKPQAEVVRVAGNTDTSISPDRRCRRRSSMSEKLEETCSSSKVENFICTQNTLAPVLAMDQLQVIALLFPATSKFTIALSS